MSEEKKNGFTLVELMVTLTIIAILTSITIAVYLQVTERAKNVTCQSNLKILRSAIVVYRSANMKNPPSLNDLDPNYIQDITGLSCPASGIPYVYDPEEAKVSCDYPPHANY